MASTSGSVEQKAVALLHAYIKEDPSHHSVVAAIRVLIDIMRESSATTFMGLDADLKAAISALTSASKPFAIDSGCEMFLFFMQHFSQSENFDSKNFEGSKQLMVQRGEQFRTHCSESTNLIAETCARFVFARDHTIILLHGDNRASVGLLLKAARIVPKRYFTVWVTEGMPFNSGEKAAELLRAVDIPVKVIKDSAVAHVMERVDMVLVGADAVVENGGILAQIGTFQVAMVASVLRKKVYVAAESFKFSRIFPLNQVDIPQRENQPQGEVDYTPPNYIELLFTDVGVLTPSAISYELIRLYQ